MIFCAKGYRFEFPRPALVMGIVNVTPDSFSDGGSFATAPAAIEHALKLVEEGADIIDVGGESTRPRATPVSEDEELRRVLPVIEALSGKVQVPISIDTVKAKVAREALEAGASIINDISANRTDEEMFDLAASSKAGYIAMHMQGTPSTMQVNPAYADVVAEVNEFFGDCHRRLAIHGVKTEQIVLDVGIGFGKTVQHNLQLLSGLQRFARWQRPLLLGVSRKSFMGQLFGLKVTERLPASIACACWAVENGVQIIRTHDVAETKQAIRMTEALMANK